MDFDRGVVDCNVVLLVFLSHCVRRDEVLLVYRSLSAALGNAWVFLWRVLPLNVLSQESVGGNASKLNPDGNRAFGENH